LLHTVGELPLEDKLISDVSVPPEPELSLLIEEGLPHTVGDWPLLDVDVHTLPEDVDWLPSGEEEPFKPEDVEPLPSEGEELIRPEYAELLPLDADVHTLLEDAP